MDDTHPCEAADDVPDGQAIEPEALLWTLVGIGAADKHKGLGIGQPRGGELLAPYYVVAGIEGVYQNTDAVREIGPRRMLHDYLAAVGTEQPPLRAYLRRP